MGRRSTTGGVKPAGDRIEVRFTWQGKELRPTLDLRPTAANLKHAKRLREDIVADIRAGSFSIAKYFPSYRFIGKHDSVSVDRRTFGDWAKTWGQLSARSLEHSTLRIYKRHLAAYWTSVWGDLPPQRITHEMVLQRLADLSTESIDENTGKVRKGLARKTQNNIMIPLRGVFEMVCKATKQPDPTDGVENLKTQKAGPDPFSPEEVEIILRDIRAKEGDDWADYFEFAFFAGMRTSEQIALQWEDVDLRTMCVLVHRSKVLGETKSRTKTNVARTVELNATAAAVIERQRARTQLIGDVVFRNPNTGHPWASEDAQQKAFMRILKRCKVRHRPPKECRDTSVTMNLQAGADVAWVAAQHGHSVQVMMRDYHKWIPKADKGRNLATVNRALAFTTSSDFAVDQSVEKVNL